MTKLSNETRKMEAEDRRRMASAARLIFESRELRFFFASVLQAQGMLENSGMGTNPFTTNALTTAHETGKVAALQALINEITAHEPHFYNLLLKEHTDDRTERTARLAACQPDDTD